VYEVLGRIGAGGMGEVYRARDTKLSRDVALKSLPDDFAGDPARRARFDREAKTLAALSHPHIAQVFGLEESVSGAEPSPRPVLVMELVEGEDLADRIGRGRLPVSDTLKIARQIIAALEAAHQAGIVHRDLKPSNIRIRPDGVVKVLDFGLARSAQAEAADSPTLTLSAPGIIVGTAAYMSPEQARGLAVDRRTDIWAFGCVLFEMLTGRRAFVGETRSDTIAAVLNADPDFTAVPAKAPSGVHRLLRRCLAKDASERLHDIADARLEIADAQQPETIAAKPTRSFAWPALAMMGFGIVSGALAWYFIDPRTESSLPVVRFVLAAGDDRDWLDARRGGIAISNDGRQIAYMTGEGLVLRSRDRLETTLLGGLGTFPGSPFFSPDGQWIAFPDAPVLKKVSVKGGQPVVIGEIGSAATGTWATEGIVFANVSGLFRLPVEGGPSEQIPIAVGATEQITEPDILPGGRAVLYTVIPSRGIVSPIANVDASRVEVVDLETGTGKVLIRGGASARYAASGHLLYRSRESLQAVAFDARRLELAGDPTPVVNEAIVEFAIAGDGTLSYLSTGRREPRTMVWVDRQGREEPLGTPPRWYLYPRISPDGTRIAVDVLGEDRDIWMWDPRRKTLERFTLDTAGNPLVAWSPDGRRVAFGSDRFGPTNLYLQAADGSGEPERVLASDHIQMPIAFAPDGRLLVSEEVQGQGRNIHVLTLDGQRRMEVLIATPANELHAEVSPNGKWIAYDSNESGQFEVYVRPYPNAGDARWRISLQGGRQPLWSRNGQELFYRDFSGAVMSMAVTETPTFIQGETTKILEGGPYFGGGQAGSARTYDIAPDGRRFLMIKEGAPATANSIVVVVNSFEELRRLAPVP
jgi:serine/threonine-protein kinase